MIENKRMFSLLSELITHNSSTCIDDFITTIESFYDKKFILPSQFRSLIYSKQLDVDSEILWILLLRRTVSLTQISTSVLK